MSYNNDPKLNQSAEFVYPFPNIISGAMYSGVPHILYAIWFLLKQTFDNPKSANLIWPYLSSRIF